MDNDKLFPGRAEDPFPKHFESVIKQIFKRLFRIYAHIYYSHFEKVVALGEEAHLNTCFKHFYYFVTEFKLVDKKEVSRRTLWCFVMCIVGVHVCRAAH